MYLTRSIDLRCGGGAPVGELLTFARPPSALRHTIANTQFAVTSEGKAMADPILFTKEPIKWECGNDLGNITLATFGFQAPGKPKGTKDLNRTVGCAYCCNTNMDLDGEPQAYGPLTKINDTLDWLQNAGWRDTDQNAAIKVAHDELAKLTKKIDDLTAASKTAVDAKSPSADLGKLQEQQAALKTKITKELHGKLYSPNAFEHGTKIKYFGTKFWDWYGVRAYTPQQASSLPPYTEVFTEKGVTKQVARTPILEKNPIYEDAFGRFPVIQSQYEPGTDFYVSVLATPVNTTFPEWDQRYFQLPDPKAQRPYAALSQKFQQYMPLGKNDRLFAIRPDTGDTLEFPILDMGNWDPKVGECSIAVFTLLNGKFAAPKYTGKPNPINNFPVLFLSFLKSASKPISTSLAEMAGAPNADELPALLSFLSQSTTDTLTNKRHSVAGEPFDEFVRWQKLNPRVNPPLYSLINQKLVAAGFKP
jgi:hypothetical protein